MSGIFLETENKHGSCLRHLDSFIDVQCNKLPWYNFIRTFGLWALSADVKDKIFQSFFYTKPTGQGRGLGLSLVYDIVKAHGRQLSAKSFIGKGTEFRITLTNI